MLLRDELFIRVKQDLIGPLSDDETIEERPVDRYLSGILYTKESSIEQGEDDELGRNGARSDDENDDTASESVILSNVVKPSCIGLSFRIASDVTPTLFIEIKFGQYLPVNDESGKKNNWNRTQKNIQGEIKIDFGSEGKNFSLTELDKSLDQNEEIFQNIFVYVKPWSEDNVRNMTVALFNNKEKGPNSVEQAKRNLYQIELIIKAKEDTKLVPRTIDSLSTDDEERSLDLLYSKVHEYAVGHTCSAEWKANENHAEYICTSWFPKSVVSKVSAEGSPELNDFIKDKNKSPYSCKYLSEASKAEVISALKLVPSGYEEWIKNQRLLAATLQEKFAIQAENHLLNCEKINKRIHKTIEYLESQEGEAAFIAFQCANKAMNLQKRWTAEKPENAENLTWRPFQIAFQLLVLESLARDSHPDKEIVDLLWFPTGGGKTEAYLGLVAFTIFHSRFKNEENPDTGAGVKVIMRYTLRLLTTQQFQRAARLVTACEYLRNLDAQIKKLSGDLPYTLGLWVGSGATANSLQAVYEDPKERKKAKQIQKCPCCNSSELSWGNDEQNQAKFSVTCRSGNPECFFSANNLDLPVWVIDEDIYRIKPSFLIGTIDKFAQIAREKRSRYLFGIDTPFSSPSLIIQDELHLISGPLGTMTGLYEMAIDELCASKGTKPKVIASTATIKNASSQITGLFNKDTSQFPPFGVYEDNSGYALKDSSDPGRLYIGLSTAGRSAKYGLQALCASILQFSQKENLLEACDDSYWTLVTYFNSLRELGGAGVMMLDDVPSSMRAIAAKHVEPFRSIADIEELTGSRSQDEINSALENLYSMRQSDGSVDVVLASSMISVGVDVDRLGVMVVNGQPKTISEYIQATSRVGRSRTPGIIFTVYNHNKSRDKSRFESFSTWHKALYRDVEGSSVTPFSSRARDKALHVPFVVLCRYLIEGLSEEVNLSESMYDQCHELIDRIYERALKVDPDEAEDVRNELEDFLAGWKRRDNLTDFWNDDPGKKGLLMSAETAITLEQSGSETGGAQATPNSMRDVEPGVTFRFARALNTRGTNNG